MVGQDVVPRAFAHLESVDADSQASSPFFRLPGEVRHHIYAATLAPFEDEHHPYDRDTYWFRPQHKARWRSDLTILLTCRRVYQEAWFLPWPLARHTFWLTASDRAPPNPVTLAQFAKNLVHVHTYRGHAGFEHIHLFAQMYRLNWAYSGLRNLLTQPHFHPQEITLTIRHTDWWDWEKDEYLRFDEDWVNKARFPASTRQINVELESLERKKGQIDSIAARMKEQWFLTSTKDEFLSARHTDIQVSRWRGSSTWARRRWVRDEVDPEYIDYYIAKVTFKHDPDLRPTSLRLLQIHSTVRPTRLGENWASIRTGLLEEARVPPNTKPDQALEMAQTFERRRLRNRTRGSGLRGNVGENVEDGGELSEFDDDDDDAAWEE